MNKFYKNGIFFSILLLSILALCEYLLSKNTKTHIDLKYNEIYNHSVKSNIAIMGNSHAAFGINPRYMENNNFSTYNFAVGGCTPLYSRIWYQYIFKNHYPKPDYFIMSVDWAMFDINIANRPIDKDISCIDFISKIKIFVNEREISHKNMVFNNFSLYTERKSLKYIFYKKQNTDIESYYNGYVKREGKGVDISFNPDSTTIDNIMLKEFQKLVSIIISDSIKLILISTPEYKPHWPDSSFTKYTAFIHKIAMKHNIPYLDFNNEYCSNINYASTLYMDWVHLNSAGADVFSQKLFSIIKDSNFFVVKSNLN